MKQLVLALVLGGAFFLVAPQTADAQVCYTRPFAYGPAYSYAPAYIPAPAYGYRSYPSAVWHPRSSVYLSRPSYGYARGYYPRPYGGYRPPAYGRYSYGRVGPRYRISIGF